MAQKLGIGEYLKELGVPYTIIDVGWWMQFYLPLPLRSDVASEIKATSWAVYRKGESKNLLTNLDHIGTYIARIITDPRTVDKAVIIWEDEVLQQGGRCAYIGRWGCAQNEIHPVRVEA